MLNGKNIILGVTGSIAAYKIANLASALVKLGASVDVIMTPNATQFITPVTFETLTSHKCIVDTFDRNFDFSVEHVSLAKKADVVLIAPASADIIGKMAAGICDNMLLTTVFATKAPVIISPAMNTGMFTNPILQDNINKLKGYGYHFIEPASGRLACGDTGTGKMPEPEVLLEYIIEYATKNDSFKGKKVLITAGPTREAIDPVRYITNHSTGKMGYAIAKAAYLSGADVTIVSGPVEIKPFHGVNVIPVKSANDMFNAVKDNYKDFDVIIMSAAVADYTPTTYVDSKIKKSDGDMKIELSRTTDILKFVGENKGENQLLIGFSMETDNLIENSAKKLKSKNADMICANSLNGNKTGFGTDTNLVTVITKNKTEELPFGTKEEVAFEILKQIKELSK
ncbi:MAG: bifunctional phosphopantothenoylcysteine decarboxylase/phosphopantothenate--cysteine ligase CoaBC [Acholeplasmatales bacterium]|nr:bifunctional phosphopantothenoylcysteine decarboxylase/phosphopantothenate--cysteine ligase CoaBC [Acholeplasmatales bacterium]